MHTNAAPSAPAVPTHGGYQIQPARHEIMWPNGSTVGVHPVRVLDAQGRAHDDMFLRAVRGGGLHWLIIDLRDVAPCLDADMRAHLPRDVPGIVYYTLRHQYANSVAFVAAAQRAIKAVLHDARAERVAA